MSGPLELYRTTVNLRGLGSGAEIEIDPMDPGWAGDIASKRIVPVVRAAEVAHTSGAGDDGARWPPAAPRGGFLDVGDWSGS